MIVCVAEQLWVDVRARTRLPERQQMLLFPPQAGTALPPHPLAAIIPHSSISLIVIRLPPLASLAFQITHALTEQQVPVSLATDIYPHGISIHSYIHLDLFLCAVPIHTHLQSG